MYDNGSAEAPLHDLFRLDLDVFRLINQALSCPALDVWMPWATWLGSGELHAALLAGLLVIGWRLAGNFRMVVTCTLTLLLTGLVVQGAKQAVPRARPTVYPTTHVLGPRLRWSSFPSGHTAGAFALAAVLAGYRRRWRPWLWSAAGLAGYSRVYLGVHYPSDVLAGAALGIWCAWGMLAAGRRVEGFHLLREEDGDGAGAPPAGEATLLGTRGEPRYYEPDTRTRGEPRYYEPDTPALLGTRGEPRYYEPNTRTRGEPRCYEPDTPGTTGGHLRGLAGYLQRLTGRSGC
jgi:undecaprenyl-diphosphatase